MRLSTICKRGIGLFIIGLCIGAASGQTTSVSITAIDTNGQHWNNGTITYSFLPPTNYTGPVYWQNAVLPASYNAPNPVSLDSNGSATFSLPDNSTIAPSGSSWYFSVCPNASTACSTFASTVVGASINLSSAFIFNLPTRITVDPIAIPKAYTDAQIKLSQGQGGLYYNTTSGTFRGWTGSAWTPIGGPVSFFVAPPQPTCNLFPSLGSNCTFQGATFSFGQLHEQQHFAEGSTTCFGAGSNEGGSVPGGPQGGLWRVCKHFEFSLTAATQGISQNLAIIQNSQKVGDNALIAAYLGDDGGVSGDSDEGNEAAALHVTERNQYFHGNISSPSQLGGTPTLNYGGGSTWTTAGGTLLNMTQAISTWAGHITSTGNLWGTYLRYLPIDFAIPKSTAAGRVDGAVTKIGTLANVTTDVTLLTTLQTITGVNNTHFIVGDHVCIAGAKFPEQSYIKAIAAAYTNGDVTQTVTIPLRHYQVPTPNSSGIGAYIFANGICGQYISADADLAGGNHMRTTYPAFGSQDGTSIITGKEVAGVMQNNLPQYAAQYWSAYIAGNTGIHLYPGAEITANMNDALNNVLDSAGNYISGPPNPIINLEYNVIQWNQNDLVEGPHYMTAGMNVLFMECNQSTPTDVGFKGSCITTRAVGPGASGQFTIIRGGLDNSFASSYTQNGGPLSPPSWASAGGQLGTTIDMDYQPFPAAYSGRGNLGVFLAVRNASSLYAIHESSSASGLYNAHFWFDPTDKTYGVGSKGNETGQLDDFMINNQFVCQQNGTHCPTQAITAATAATFTPATGVTSVTCTSATCNSSRGTLSVNGGTATTGSIFTVTWPSTTQSNVCNISQGGSASWLGLTHTIATSTGFIVSAFNSISGLTFNLDYTCLP